MIEYRFNAPIEAHQLASVFAASGIRRPSDDLERLSRMLDGADVLISAWDQGKLVGVCRALTDHSYCCYLSDLAVDRAYQGGGIGTSMIDQLCDRVGEEVSIVLIAAPAAVDYYPHVGFERADNAFVMKRTR